MRHLVICKYIAYKWFTDFETYLFEMLFFSFLMVVFLENKTVSCNE